MLCQDTAPQRGNCQFGPDAFHAPGAHLAAHAQEHAACCACGPAVGACGCLCVVDVCVGVKLGRVIVDTCLRVQTVIWAVCPSNPAIDFDDGDTRPSTFLKMGGCVKINTSGWLGRSGLCLGVMSLEKKPPFGV